MPTAHPVLLRERTETCVAVGHKAEPHPGHKVPNPPPPGPLDPVHPEPQPPPPPAPDREPAPRPGPGRAAPPGSPRGS
ncbi:hypothetical protein [Streptomyces sp. NPDC058773]|uniref:hypothetical protein n=1 Tax=Streptomyces sp. NPDC058773 TaxID=3346632 RepID=UPI003692F876